MPRSPLPAPWPTRLTTPRLLLRPVEAADVKDKNTDAAVIGLVSVEPDTRRGNRAEVSYQLLPEYWGLGYAGEAVGRVVAWVLDHVDVGPPAVVAVTQEANTRSRRLLERMGMGVVDRFVEFDAPQVMYSISIAPASSWSAAAVHP
ncbi:GNAT family N-acetyltransferase [Streptomyces sp. NPDC091292]|uniref:GNAT family N-acetyltransferase n=1 Tax=Streptomyces sp. NPDC091292 TaxID=3365991 RepID=UPI00381D22BB